MGVAFDNSIMLQWKVTYLEVFNHHKLVLMTNRQTNKQKGSIVVLEEKGE